MTLLSFYVRRVFISKRKTIDYFSDLMIIRDNRCLDMLFTSSVQKKIIVSCQYFITIISIKGMQAKSLLRNILKKRYKI